MSQTVDILVNMKGNFVRSLNQASKELKETTRDLKGMTRGFQNVETESKKAGNSVEKFGNKASSSLNGVIKKIGLAAAAFAGLRIGQNIIQTFAGFDDVMRQVGAVSGATAEEFKELTDIAKKMGAETRYSAAEAAEGLKFLSMAGFDAKSSVAALPGVLNLAAAGSLELGQAADIATNILSAYGKEISELGGVNDVLTATFTNTNSTLIELGEAFKMVGPIAKGLDADFNDIVGALGMLHSSGIKGTMAGSSLRGALEALYNPTADEAKLLAELSARIGGVGLQIKDSEGKFVGFVNIVEQLEKSGIRGEEALRLFGLRAGPSMAALVEKGSDSLEELNVKLDNSSGITDKIATRMEGGLGGALRALVAGFEAVKIAIGEIFELELQQFAVDMKGYVTELIEKLKELQKSGEGVKFAKKLFEALKFFLDATVWVGKFIVQWNELIFVFMGTKIAITVIKSLMTTIALFQTSLIPAFISGLASLRLAIASVTSGVGVLSLAFKGLIVFAAAQGIVNIAKLTKEIWNWRKAIVGADKAQENLNKTLQTSIERFKPFAHIIMPKDLTKTTQEELKDLNDMLRKSQAYWVNMTLAAKDPAMKKDAVAMLKKVKDQLKDIQALQRGEQIGAEPANKESIKTVVPIVTVSDLNKAKSQLSRMESINQLHFLKIDKLYGEGLISLDDYFNEKNTALVEQQQKEIEIQQRMVDSESDPTKKLRSEDKLFALKKNHEVQLLNLSMQRDQEESNIEEKRLQAQNLLSDIQSRKIAEDEYGLTSGFEKERSEMDMRHADELANMIELSDEKFAIEQGYVDKISLLRDVARQQELEKEKLLADQKVQLQQRQLDVAMQVAGGTADLFDNLYQMTGEKQKAFFYISKAAAVAQAMMNIAQGVTKAMAQGGIFGIITGATVAAAGMAQIAKIKAQSMAEGGLVGGFSPTNKSDNIDIKGTAGEFMEPISTVQKYGLDNMEGLRQGIFPADIFDGYSIRMPAMPKRKVSYAEGGSIQSIPQSAKENQQQAQEIKIVNVIDPRQVLDVISSTPEGQDTILNVIDQRQTTARQILRTDNDL